MKPKTLVLMIARTAEYLPGNDPAEAARNLNSVIRSAKECVREMGEENLLTEHDMHWVK